MSDSKAIRGEFAMSKEEIIETAKAIAIMVLVLFLMGVCGGIERGTIPFF